MSTQNGSSSPRRVRWSVPTADVSVNRWLDLQDSISDSVRLLIRESIQREGYVDVVNKPVGQLPRRGRPPGDANEQGGRPSAEPDDADATSGPQEAADEPSGSATDVVGSEPAASNAPSSADDPPVVRRPQASIDEVMSSTRR